MIGRVKVTPYTTVCDALHQVNISILTLWRELHKHRVQIYPTIKP